MAKTNYRGYLQQELVPLKKYFYVLRPLLAVRWMEKFATPAPIEFDRLLEVAEKEEEFLDAVQGLLEVKRRSPELGLSPQVPAIQQFIEAELARLEQVTPARMERTGDVSLLSDAFRTVLPDTWGKA